MPFTFLSHQAPVLPLKMAAPRRWDGTALVVGSMAPDLFFGARGTRWYVEAHEFFGPFWLCIPLTLAITWTTKRFVAGPVAAHLPDLGGWRLSDYGRLSDWRWPRDVRGNVVVVGSAFVGGFTHIALDSVTHGFGLVVRHSSWLRTKVASLPGWGGDVYVHDVLQVVFTVVGAGVAAWCLWVVGRDRLLARWHPDAVAYEADELSARWIATGLAAGALLGLLLAIWSMEAGGPQAFLIRVCDLAYVGLVLGCVGALRTMRPIRELPGGRDR